MATDTEEQVTTEEEETNEEVENESTQEEEISSADASEIDKMRTALKKANKEAAKFRNELKDLRTQSESDSEKAVREAAEQATNEVESKYKRHLVQAEARAQLAEMGLSTKADRFLKMLDLEDITVDDEGDIAGLKDQLLAIKGDFPEVFKKKLPSADLGPKSPADKNTSSAAKLLAQLNED